MLQHNTVGLTFANYNYAFTSFYDQYKKLCFKISENTQLQDLKEIRKNISTFIYENEYTLDEIRKRNYYKSQLQKIKEEMELDNQLKSILTKDMDYTINKILYRRKYYQYFLKYLYLLGQFVSELSTSYMPNTNLQRKLLRFSNNAIFFEKFTQHKEKVLDCLSDFNIRKFTESFNILVTFYFAYSLFVNKQDQLIINNLFSLALSYYLDRTILQLLAKREITHEQAKSISKIESELHKVLLFCLSIMNQSFSNYDVLPKLRNKVYIDKTLI